MANLPGITVRVIDKNRFFKEMMERATDATRLLQRSGERMVAASKGAFAAQAWGGVTWPARSTPSVGGIVHDLSRGAAVSPERFKARPALLVTGALRESIDYQVLGRTSVRVFSRSPYASVHQSGGTIHQAITPTVRANLSLFLRANPGLRPKLGFLFRRTDLATTVPARPFLGMTPLLRAQVTTLTRDWVLQRGEFRRT